VKIPIQTKVAELEARLMRQENRIMMLERAILRKEPVASPTETAPMTPEQSSAWKKAWFHFDSAMDEIGRIFK
jgi:hypothetical protein